MDTPISASPRIEATSHSDASRREGRARQNRARTLLSAGTGFALAAAIAACTPGASTAPLPSIAVPSVDVSPLASAASQAAIAALDQIDVAITANGTATGLTADDQTQLKGLTADLRMKIQSGDMPSARTAFGALSAKVDELAAKLNTDVGKQLKDAVAALGALIPPG